jgi:folate-binding protein YgfZ
MSGLRFVPLGLPTLLEFRGPDAVRFLNGQLTQDVRKVVTGALALPSCVTDAKGKLQFRVRITARAADVLWIEGPEGCAEELDARLTRYLIADDVEVADLTGTFTLCHLLGAAPEAPADVIARESNRFGDVGTDWWVPVGTDLNEVLPSGAARLEEDELEERRIRHGVPVWGRELVAGMLPPEAGLEDSDISYHKGCYIGQEVISRIKSAGKVNRRLARLICDAQGPLTGGILLDGEGKPSGELTSVSPRVVAGERRALGYIRRGTEPQSVQNPDGSCTLVRIE